MINFKINKFLTEITDQKIKVYIKTSAFQEITGIEDISQLENVGIFSEQEETMGKREYMEYISLNYSFCDRYRLLINGKQCHIKKVLEACDLHLPVFESMIRNASLLSINTNIGVNINYYLTFIRQQLIKILFQSLADPLPQNLSLISVNWQQKQEEKTLPPPLFSLDSPVASEIRSNIGFIDWNRVKTRDVNIVNTTSLNKHFIDPIAIPREDVSNLVQKINVLYANMPFYCQGEELFLQPVTVEKITKIFQACQRYGHSVNPSAGIDLHSDILVDILLKEVKRGVSQNLMILMNSSGQTQIYNLGEVSTHINRLIIEQVGMYGTAKILKWNLDVSKEIH